MTGWEWLALAAAVGIPLAVAYTVHGSLAEAYWRGYAEGFEEGVSEATRTVRTHSTQRATSADGEGQGPGLLGAQTRPQ